MNPHYPEMAARARHRCEYCRAPEALFNVTHEVEHIVPRAKGGPDHPDNLALSCRHCNLRKQVRTEGTDPNTGRTAPLFNPRSHRWEEHFRVDLEAKTIQGLTPVGRATVECLDLNSPTQLFARQQWARLDEWP